ncbi:hypothetical protein MMPV_006817 [Pyropia vietnamensis]
MTSAVGTTSLADVAVAGVADAGGGGSGGGGGGGGSGGGGSNGAAAGVALAAASAATAATVEGGTVQTSLLDDRRYRIVTLPTNGLRVMVVSDPAADKAAASLDVAVGHFSDPDDIPGLAHFLEHMLFLGTEKYPDEASYNAFLAENGGHSNAFTASENTNYHFSIMVSKGATATADGNAGGSGEGGGLGGDAVADAATEPLDNSAPAAATAAPVTPAGDSGTSPTPNDSASGGEGGGEGGLSRYHEALDRFAQFFIHPLFTESATARELKAVDSEHANNLQSDPHRMYQMHKTAASAAHPYSKFGTGTAVTLRDTPAEKGIDVRAALLRFHAVYYSANLMCLTLVAPAPLDTLVGWAAELFSAIPNHNAPSPAAVYADAVAFGPKQTGRIYRVQPIKDMRALEILWVVPPFHTVYRTKPSNYVSHLLGHEGPGSLLSELKARGWADGLSAGSGKATLHWEAFEVSVDLTEAGAVAANDVIEAVYGYLALVREQGVQRWIHDEAAALAEMAWRFKEREDPMSLAVSVSTSMHLLPDEHVLSASRLFFDYDEAGIRDFLALLTPAAGTVLYVDKGVANIADAVEPWYGTPYRAEVVEPEMLARWAAAAPLPTLAIPKPNAFIPTDFELVADQLPLAEEDADVAAAQREDAAVRGVASAGATAEAASTTNGTGSDAGDVALDSGEKSGEGPAEGDAVGTCAVGAAADGQCAAALPAANEPDQQHTTTPDVPRPRVLRDDASMRLHFKLDRTFQRPKVNVMLNLVSPVAYTSPRDAVLAYLSAMMIGDALNEYAYDANLAGLRYELLHSPTGFYLAVWGYSHKVPVLLSAICEQLATFRASPTRFVLLSELLRREYKNFFKEQPYTHAIYVASMLTESPRWHVWDYMSYLEEDARSPLTPADVDAFVASLRSALHVEMLVHGNIRAGAAMALARQLESTLGYAPLCALQRPHQRVVQLPLLRPVLAAIPGPNAGDVNSAVQVLFQLGLVGDPRMDVAVSLLRAMINKPIFHTLRTEEQLGYLVYSGMKRTHGVQALRVIVQSTVAAPAEVVRRIEACLATFGNTTLPEMKESQFREYVAALSASLQETDKQLMQQSSRFWGEISAGTYEYGRHVSELAALRQLTRADLIAIWNRFMPVGAPERRVLISSVHSPKYPVEDMSTGGAGDDGPPPLVVRDAQMGSAAVLAFRNSQLLYPVVGYHSGPIE